MSTICDDLRAAILQAAMQGKLTGQLSEDGNAEDLLEEIKAEKEKLISVGKIKKQKPLAPIIDDEIPFSIPKNWKWVRMDSIFNIHSSIRIHQSDWKTSGVPFFRGRELVKLARDGDVDPEIFITKELYEENKRKGGVPQKDDILVSAVGTIGKVYIVKADKPFYYKDAYVLCFDNIGNMTPRFIKYAIEAPCINDVIMRGSMGTTVAQLTIDKAKNLLLPLPPLAEQKRIVEKIDELMARVADLEQLADALASLKKAFPDDIKASLLQAAMQGKLTKQLPEDGNAEDLLEEIKAEKEKLIAEGKIKKRKSLAPITDDEIPFSIPDNWKWVRLRDICTKIADGDHNPPKGLTHESEYLMLSSQNINNDTLVNMSRVRYLDKNTFEKVNERTNLQKEDILFTSVGSLGRSCIFREDINACFQRSVSVLTTLVYNEYLKLFLDSPFIQNKVYKEATGTAQKGFYLNQLEKCPIAIPPLAEQRRIVERLNTLMQNINVVGDLIASE